MAKTSKVMKVAERETVSSVKCEDVRLLAYLKWEQAGRPAGDGTEFWLQAESELSGQVSAQINRWGKQLNPSAS